MKRTEELHNKIQLQLIDLESIQESIAAAKAELCDLTARFKIGSVFQDKTNHEFWVLVAAYIPDSKNLAGISYTARILLNDGKLGKRVHHIRENSLLTYYDETDQQFNPQGIIPQ